MLKIFLFSLLFFPKLSFSQDTINNTGSKISSEDAQAILDHHNKIRNDLNIPPLSWSAELASYAQAWADSLASSDNCTLQHREHPSFGENLYMASSSESFKPVSASLAWYSEIEKYTYSKIGEGNWQSSLHYTQMIWKNTKELGVGMATCPNGNVIVVANYSPSGNYSGEYPY
jgi:pathogenesis-related protein 1